MAFQPGPPLVDLCRLLRGLDSEQAPSRPEILRSDPQLLRDHDVGFRRRTYSPRIFAFSAANSSSVRMPSVLSFARRSNSLTCASVRSMAEASAGAAGVSAAGVSCRGQRHRACGWRQLPPRGSAVRRDSARDGRQCSADADHRGCRLRSREAGDWHNLTRLGTGKPRHKSIKHPAIDRSKLHHPGSDCARAAAAHTDVS